MRSTGNLRISETSLGVPKNSQRSSDFPGMKYKCVILFLRQMYWFFIYVSKSFDTLAEMFDVPSGCMYSIQSTICLPFELRIFFKKKCLGVGLLNRV